ncbi:MAG: hypothetical protein LBQ89_04730 [Treponema sp.]|nr:hypothetical protein [Treponema sp.]
MTVSQKILCSFLLSAFLCAGIATLAVAGIFADYGGIVGEWAQLLMFVAIFLTLFLIIFFCFNLRRDSTGETDKKTLEVLLSSSHEYEEPEEIETAEEMSADSMSADAVQVESVAGPGGNFFMFRQPFTFTPGNPELLQGAGNADIMSDVVYEEDGIHYINSNVFADDERRDEFDSNFAKLVESVVNKVDA